MAYVKSVSKYLNARRFGALPSHGWVPRITYSGRSHSTVLGAWWMCKEEYGTVMEHAEKGIDKTVLCDTLEAMNVASSVELAHEVASGWHPNEWLAYCALQWLLCTLLFLVGPKA